MWCEGSRFTYIFIVGETGWLVVPSAEMVNVGGKCRFG